MIDFVIVRNEDPDAFAAEVLRLLKDGYATHGDYKITELGGHVMHWQAMYLTQAED